MAETYAVAPLRQGAIDSCLLLARQAGEEWRRAWQPSLTIAVACAAASDAAPAGLEWKAYRLASGHTVWCAWPATWNQFMTRALFELDSAARGAEQHSVSPLATGAAEAAAADLLATLFARLGLGTPPPVAEDTPGTWLWHPYSGAAQIRLGIGLQAIWLLLPAPLLPYSGERARPRARAAIVPLAAALAPVPVRLLVELAQADVPIGLLASLALGDVVRLPVSTEQSMTVLSGDRRLLCAAHLGRQGDHRALEIFKSNHS